MILRHLAVLAIVVSCSASAQFPFHRSLEVHSGQRKPRITQLAFDAQGLIWTGSDLGVYRTDGERVTTMLRSETAHVTALSAQGEAIYVALTDGTLMRCAATSCDTVINDTLLKFAPIRTMAVLPNGTVCLATYGAGVWFLDKHGVKRITIQQGVPDDNVNDIAVLDGERVVAATDQGLAVLSADGVVEVFDEAHGAPDNLLMAVEVMADGTVVAGTDGKGVFTWRPGSRAATILGNAWKHGAVTDIVVDQEQVWVGTRNDGIVVYDTGAGKGKLEERDHMGAITGMLRDAEGAIWWCDGTDRIHRADPAILLIPEHEDQDLRAITALCVDVRDRVWMATPQGLFHHPNAFPEGDHLVRVPLVVDQRKPIVSLAASRNGTVWAASFGNGVYAIDASGRIQHFKVADGLRNENVLAVRAAGDSVWFATLDGACLWAGGRFQPVNGTSGFTFDVLPMGKDDALVATDGQGVISYQRGLSTAVRTDVRTFYSLARADDGAVWAVGPAGLCRVRGEPLVCTGTVVPVFDGDVFAMAASNGRQLVFGSVGTWAYDGSYDTWTDLTERLGTHAIKAELNAVAIGSEGEVWFASDKGLMRLQLDEAHFRTTIPVVITDVIVNGDRVPVSEQIKTTFDRNTITVRFAAGYYADPGAVRFEYRIGAGGEVLRTSDRELAFAGLSPGTHLIQLRAFVGLEPESAAWRTITVMVAAPWWRRPWVVGLLILAAAALVVIILRARERRLRDRDRMEQEKVRFQLEALRSQVDPHFLFNSFNTLVSLIETDQERAVEHVDALSTFFRSMLVVRDKDLIPLQEEFDLLRSYFGLEQRRFGNAIDLFINFTGDPSAYRIVPLTLQLLVENALKHNVATVNEPLRVEVLQEGEYLVVRNPIRPRASAARSTSFGLDSIMKRYAAFTSRTVRVEHDQTHFQVHIPLLTRHEDPDR